VTDAAERLKTLRARLEDAAVAHGSWAAAPLTNADGLWLADQLDRSVDREAVALTTPPGRAARLEAVAAEARRTHAQLGSTHWASKIALGQTLKALDGAEATP
jgi:hypothetical protein